MRRLARKFHLRADNIFPVGAWPGDSVEMAIDHGQSPGNVVELAMPPLFGWSCHRLAWPRSAAEVAAGSVGQRTQYAGPDGKEEPLSH